MQENNTNFHQVVGEVKNDVNFKITTNSSDDNVSYVTIDEIKQKPIKEILDNGVVVKATPSDILKEYLSDESNLKRLDELALQFHSLTRGKWFTAGDLGKKVLKDMKPHVSLYLDLLVLSKKAFSKKRGESIIYKITLNSDLRKKLITNYIVELEKMLEYQKNELKSLE